MSGRFLLTVFILLVAASVLFPQQKDIDESLLEQMRAMSLEEILDMKISIASQTKLSMREAPGSVTLITREEILNTGARDLLDVLNLLVPGFDFMQTEYGPIGAGVRGIWGYEGKVLLLVDGIELNEEGFSGILFGNHFPPENIERIEIIRGPGSVIYGGYAGLGVINIITRGYKELEGVYAGVQYSRMYETYSHRNLNFGAGGKTGEFGYSLTGSVGEGKLSDRDFVPYFNAETLQSSSFRQDPLNLNMNLNYKGFDFRGIYERYNLVYGIPMDFNGYNIQLKYENEIAEKLTLTAKLGQKRQKPWVLRSRGLIYIDGALYDTTYANNKIIDKKTAVLSTNWGMTDRLHLLTGIEYYNTDISIEPEPGWVEIPFGNNYTDHIENNHFAAYSQLMYSSGIANFTLGGRYEKTDDFGDSFVPRFALTKLYNRFHFKIMISKSFRIPGGRYYNTDLKPEKGTNYELELGYQLTKSHFFLLNLYDIQYRDVISLRPDPEHGGHYYDNSDEIGTRGFELEYRLVKKKFNLGSNFSYHTVYENSVEAYAVEGLENRVLGFPEYKLNFYAGINISEQVSINPSFTYYGPRYGYIGGDVNYYLGTATVSNTLKMFESTYMINLNFRTKDVITKGLQADIGVRNLLNTNYEYIQPFKGYKSPLPAASASLVLRIYYETDFSF